MSIESDMKEAAIQAGKMQRAGNDQRSDHFRLVRVRVRGTLIMAHGNLADRPMGPLSELAWTEEDDRIMDIVMLWLDKLRDRRG